MSPLGPGAPGIPAGPSAPGGPRGPRIVCLFSRSWSSCTTSGEHCALFFTSVYSNKEPTFGNFILLIFLELGISWLWHWLMIDFSLVRISHCPKGWDDLKKFSTIFWKVDFRFWYIIAFFINRLSLFLDTSSRSQASIYLRFYFNQMNAPFTFRKWKMFICSTITKNIMIAHVPSPN